MSSVQTPDDEVSANRARFKGTNLKPGPLGFEVHPAPNARLDLRFGARRLPGGTRQEEFDYRLHTVSSLFVLFPQASATDPRLAKSKGPPCKHAHSPAICAAIALLTPLVHPGSLGRGGKGI